MTRVTDRNGENAEVNEGNDHEWMYSGVQNI